VLWFWAEVKAKAKRQGQQQIPFGDDNKKDKGKDNSRFPSGMTARKTKAKTTADSLRE
jgi:hypothetical protein